MTPYQQLILFDPDAFAETIYFNSEEEYMEWLSTRER